MAKAYIDQLTGKTRSTNQKVQLNINGTNEHDSQVMAEHFNEYFINSVLQLSKNFINVHASHKVVTNSDSFLHL